MRWQTVWSVKAARITTTFFSQTHDRKSEKERTTNNKPSNSNSETIYEGCFIATLFSNRSTQFSNVAKETISHTSKNEMK